MTIPLGTGRAYWIAIDPNGKTAYATGLSGLITPINLATNTPGKPIPAGADAQEIAITPDGKTVYVAGLHTVTPISTATNTPGKPIPVRYGIPEYIAITP